MGKLTLHIIWMLLFIQFHAGAVPNIDSLKQVLQSTPQDTNRINTLIQLAYAYKYDSLSLSMAYAQTAVELSKSIDEKPHLIKSYLCQAKVYDFQGDNLRSESIARKGLVIAREIESDEWIAQMTNHVGTALLSQYKMPDALTYFHESLKYYELLNDTANILLSYHYIGWVYHQLLIFDKTLTYYDNGIALAQRYGDTTELMAIKYDKAWVFYQQENYAEALREFWGLRHLAHQSSNNHELVRALSMLGSVYATQEQPDSALYYYRLCSQLSLQEKDWFELSSSYEGIGDLYAKNQRDSASYYYEKALAITQQHGSPTILAYTQSSLGEFWLQQKQYEKSIYYLEQARTFFQEGNDDRSVAQLLATLGEVYYQQGKGKLAYETLRQAKELEDSIYTEENKELLEETEVRYEVRKKEEEILLLNEANQLRQEQIRQQRLLLIAIIAILVLMIGLALASYRAYRQKQRANRLLEDQNEEIRQQHAATEQARRYIEQHAERLKELDSLKTRFFANVSHELRTPLTLILGPLQRLLEQNQVKDGTKKDLQLMERNSTKLLGLVEEILDISKLDAEKLQLHETATHVSSFIRRIYANFESQAHYLSINYNLIEQVPEQLHALLDQNRVEKILNNLLSNAMKFTQREGTVVVSSQLQDGFLQIMVRDTGEGISSEDLPHVFERFFQTKHSHAKAIGGTGIGLALSKELAEIMGGSLHVSSTLGKGSTFKLSIPFKETVAPPTEIEPIIPIEIEDAHSENSSLIPAKTHRILIVEDNPDMQGYVVSLIQHEYAYVVAKDGKEALEILEQEGKSIDLVLSDVMMPRMDGVELLQHVKSIPELQSIPFIMLTARAAQEDKLNALTIGVDDYLIKPFFQNELLVRMQNLLANYQARKEWQELSEEEPEDSINQQHEPENDVAMSESDQTWINQVERQIRERIHQIDYSINLLAEHMHISTRQFQRKLKKATGMTPVKYQQEIRLQIAREHLESGKSKSVKEVAYRVGFQKVSYFSKLYLARFGKRPSDYLK
ncbi:MAG: ATP-binding protein [Flammeovirgaceae bacterium]